MPKSLLYKPIERVEYCMDQVYSITNDLKIKSSKKPLFETFAFNFKKLKLLLRQQSHPDDTAALLIEPILGEGGYVVPPNGYLEGIQNICKENGIMLMLDEVQSGFGRTGEFFAFSHFRTIEPDVLIIAKGIGSGYPISAVISSKENTDFQPPMTVGGTYAGNVVSCAAAKATIETIKSENLIENCRKMGGVLIKGLMDIKNKFPEHILEIRGIGLMIALEFRAEKCVNNVAAVVVQMCAERGVLLMTTSVFEVIRLVPPLVIKEEEIKKMLNVLEEVMDDVFKRV